MSNTVSPDQELNEANILERVDELAALTPIEYESQRKKLVVELYLLITKLLRLALTICFFLIRRTH